MFVCIYMKIVHTYQYSKSNRKKFFTANVKLNSNRKLMIRETIKYRIDF